MQFIDTHAHFTDEKLFAQLQDVLTRATNVGVDTFITVGTDLPDSQAAMELAARYDKMYSTAGIHPHEAKAAEGGYLKSLEEMAASKKVVAIGECGLDYHYDLSPRDIQKRVFMDQLELASKLQCPVVVHCRNAFDDCVGILSEWQKTSDKVVFHCYSGDRAMAKTLLDMGCFLSFTGTITYKNAQPVQEAAAYAPLDRIFIETDCPYLT
ncbi:MAG: TatD family hydrolase, partial [Phycisphaerae bacterium]|nr:TatD family hydrolase [Phycisphaerae bacterium]